MAKNIKWGIIGLGNIANKFAQAIIKMFHQEIKQNLLNLGKNIVYQKNIVLILMKNFIEIRT